MLKSYFLVVACSLTLIFTGCEVSPSEQNAALLSGAVVEDNLQETAMPRVCFSGDRCFDVEIADEPSERALGLMHREVLPDSQGMLFIFEQSGNYRFRMKNTLISLDMLWLNEQFEVVHIEQHVPPCNSDPCPSYGPSEKRALYVLELNAGQVREQGTVVGDTLTYER